MVFWFYGYYVIAGILSIINIFFDKNGLTIIPQHQNNITPKLYLFGKKHKDARIEQSISPTTTQDSVFVSPSRSLNELPKSHFGCSLQQSLKTGLYQQLYLF